MTAPGISRFTRIILVGAVLWTALPGAGAGSAGVQTFQLLRGFENPPANPHGEVIEGSDGALYGTTYSGGTYGYGIVFKVNRNGTGFLKLHDFNGADPANGSQPEAGLVEGSDGDLYGTTAAGGTYGAGIVFKIGKEGSGFSILHEFNYNDATNGGLPHAGLLEGSDGGLYGTTVYGGAFDSGIVFKVAKDGTGFLRLHDFKGSDPADGAYPEDGLREGSDGALYGNTTGGGVDRSGVVFKLNKDGTGFLKLHDFSAADPANGASPQGELAEGSDGALYGMTSAGGAYNWGIVFKIRKDGTGFLKLHDFDLQNGGGPQAGVIEGSDGALYGTTALGGAYGYGTFFKVDEDGSGFVPLRNLDAGDGTGPLAALVEGSDGRLYGTAADGGAYNWGVVFRLDKSGSGFMRVHDFSPSVGAFPYAKLLKGTDGALYGTTHRGGAHGSGIVFKLIRGSVGFPANKLQTLHAFDFNDPTNGSYPYAGLIEASDGALYGTTLNGGQSGAGTVFKVRKDGTGFVKLHDFEGSDGSQLYGGVIEGSDGALYGTAYSGGAFASGVVFKVNKDGSGFVKLHDFDYADRNNGAYPYAGLVEGSDGALYGTTFLGGGFFGGIVFRMNKDGSGFLVLVNFDLVHSASGGNPQAELIEGSDGALYGTAAAGGSGFYGVVFKVDKDGGGFLKLHDFSYTDPANGSYPYAALVEGSGGALYGTTSGGTVGAGTIFKVNRDGTGFLTLHAFSGSDGANPYAGLVQGAKGALYGTASGGGPRDGGVVFALVK